MRKKIILSIISIILTSFCLVTLTFSWFAFNDQVQAMGLTVSVKDVENLVICENEVDILDFDSENKVFSISNYDTMSEMIACTHSDTSATFLRYVANTYDIDIFTGLPKAGKNYEYVDAPDSRQYFFDTTVYIASIQEAMTGVELYASILNVKTAQTNPIHLAASVDFYLGDVSVEGFKGTLNLAGLDASINDASTTKDRVVILDGVSEGETEIPLNTDGFIMVTMRFYFDGNLNATATKTFINTNEIDTSEIALQINFGVEELD